MTVRRLLAVPLALPLALAIAVLLAVHPTAQRARTVAAVPDDTDFASFVKTATTRSEYSSPLIDHLPRRTGVPTPKDVLGYHVGTEKKLTYWADQQKWYRALEKALPGRVRTSVIGRTEEGREIMVVYIASDESLKTLEQNRANMRRLDFESIRDSMLLLTGKLDPAVGGQPVNITDEPYSYRRSVYGFVDRLNLSDLMSQFDFSNPEMTNSRRITTIVPQQALFFMNNALPIEVARQVMARREVAGAPDDTARVAEIYQILFQRKPRDKELQLAGEFIGRATKEAEGRPEPPKKDPKTKMAPPKHVGTMMMEMDPKAEMDTSKMSEMARNKFAMMRNEGELIDRSPLSPWELYVQALLFSNEFVYVN